jgi:hypothetical protein
MKSLAVGIALVFVCSISTVFAKGSGGHGSGSHGGHGGGGHGGHAAGGHSGGHATGGHASGGTHGSTAPHGKSVARGSSGTASTSSKSRTTARARDGRPITGTAVERTGAAPPIATHPNAFAPAPYRFSPYTSSALRFSARNFYYDPFWASYGYAPDPFDANGPTGGLRMNVEPKDAEVYVDGYYAGIVDDFDGHFQHLTLVPGPHRVEVRAPGYLTLVFDVSIQAHHTTEYRGALQR